jgi:hypothetical protein
MEAIYGDMPPPLGLIGLPQFDPLREHRLSRSVALENGSPNPEKGDFVPFAKLTRKKVTFGLIG